MGVENTTDRIISYLNIPKTNYAIFLDGAWGIGKSYFVFNKLKSKIKSDVQYDIQYFSLNGVGNIETLKKQVLFSLLSEKKQMSTQILSVVSSFSSSLSSVSYVGKISGPVQFFANASHNKLLKVDIEKQMMKKLLIFDDLERVQSIKVIEEFFGFISMTFLELTDTKIMLIGNEDEIVKKTKINHILPLKKK
ncbi:hypothetical protein HCB25_03645 [Listeria booriae]|uniref:KAP NTPase domain-containing protein n=1 Tax=Listeria booriae TaxID=1552123 RepID=A0A842F2Y4_9LIST|nr:P-loop NTPase fold protein [Listeria booriae]MBC2243148.1 hypothetical protein [Listeria booriae]